jgi:hypothetical protein
VKKVNKRLYAFWKYDTFPYVLGGELRDMNDRGLVYIESYQGWFRPILILPLEEGKKIHDKIKKISSSYQSELKNIKKIKTKEIIEVCPQLNPFLS